MTPRGKSLRAFLATARIDHSQRPQHRQEMQGETFRAWLGTGSTWSQPRRRRLPRTICQLSLRLPLPERLEISSFPGRALLLGLGRHLCRIIQLTLLKQRKDLCTVE